MTRAQLEASWGWSDERGSIPYKRPRLTQQNIDDQDRLARPGTLIHYAGNQCERSLAGVDVVNNTDSKSLAVASHIENVNCLRCRKDFYGREKRRRMGRRK